MSNSSSAPSQALDANSPRPAPVASLPPHLERKIAGQWKRWEGWVRMQQLRSRDYDPAVAEVESARMRQHHQEYVLAMTQAGISMRTIRRHRLDDPRVTDEVRAMLVAAAKERQSKARYRRPEDQRNEERLAMLIRLGPITRKAANDAPNELPEANPPSRAVALDPSALKD